MDLLKKKVSVFFYNLCNKENVKTSIKLNKRFLLLLFSPFSFFFSFFLILFLSFSLSFFLSYFVPFFFRLSFFSLFSLCLSLVSLVLPIFFEALYICLYVCLFLLHPNRWVTSSWWITRAILAKFYKVGRVVCAKENRPLSFRRNVLFVFYCKFYKNSFNLPVIETRIY